MPNYQITDEQVLSAVQTVVDEEMPDAVRDAVMSHADKVIKERVAIRIGPVVDDMLANEQFVTGEWGEYKTPLDEQIKGAVRAYLDERVYLYAKTDDRPSVRFTRTTMQRSCDGPTRLEAFLRYAIERFCDEHLATKLESTVKAFLDQRGGIEQIARQEMAQLLKEKFKL